MSATLDPAPVAAFLKPCPVIESAGRVYPLAVRHLGYSPEPLEAQVCGAVELALAQPETGHILAFLPGASEIRRAARACAPLAARAGLDVLPLHGDLSPDEQDRAVAPASRRKLILATNVAESSITIAGVTTVIDSGLARIAGHSAWTGLPTLALGRISQASARQRAGRAGRTSPGAVLRLYAKEDLRRRPEHDPPEILRADLTHLCLALRAMGIGAPGALAWLDPPPAAAVNHAEALLDRLDARGAPAADLARYPLHPRLARLVVESVQRGVGRAGCAAAALLASGLRPGATDLLAALDAQASSAPDPHWLRQLRQLERLARPDPRARVDRAAQDDALLQSVLAGFPDRVAKRRSGRQLTLANGVGAESAGEPPPYEFLTALDAEDRAEKATPLVRLTARIEPEWLLEMFPDRVRAVSRLEWNREAERVDAVESLLYDALTLEETRGAMPDPEAAAALLAAKALEAGLDRFVDPAARAQFEARVAFAGLEVPDPAVVLRELCAGLRGFAQLREAAGGFLSVCQRRLPAATLSRLAPETLRLARGRTTPVHYEAGKPPWIASRIQDFFGMRDTPRLGPAQTPVVIHLLAPSRRPVQMTTDLAGFWQRLYPELRRQLQRRYPKHPWPEHP